MTFVPVMFREDFIEWAPRESGKGIVQVHSDKSILDKCDITSEGKYTHGENRVVNTASFFGLYTANESKELSKCFISMTGVQWKKARKLLTIANTLKLDRKDGSKYVPPLWYMGYKFSTQPESNVQGEWYGWSIDMDEPLPKLCKRMNLTLSDIVDASVDFSKAIAETQPQKMLPHDEEEDSVM